MVEGVVAQPRTGTAGERRARLTDNAAGISLQVEQVSVTYPNGHVALVDASFELGEQTICALVGINGSGKSTLFKAVMGFVTPSQGQVRLAGLNLGNVARQLEAQLEGVALAVGLVDDLALDDPALDLAL